MHRLIFNKTWRGPSFYVYSLNNLKSSNSIFLFFSGECGVRNIYLRTDDFITNLTSPGYPSGYRNDLNCLWTVFGRQSRHIVVNILDFQMETGFDFLTIGNGHDSTSSGSVIARLSGKIKLQTLTSNRIDMWIQIAADRTGTGKGFNLELLLTKNVEGWCTR